MDGRRSGMVLVAIGLVVAVVGVFGFVTDRGAASTVAVASPVPSATLPAVVPSQAGTEATPSAPIASLPTASPTPALTPSSTPAPSPTPNAEARVRAFYTVLAPAIRSGDVETLFSLLHPASIERYGAAGCRASFAPDRGSNLCGRHQGRASAGAVGLRARRPQHDDPRHGRGRRRRHHAGRNVRRACSTSPRSTARSAGSPTAARRWVGRRLPDRQPPQELAADAIIRSATRFWRMNGVDIIVQARSDSRMSTSSYGALST